MLLHHETMFFHPLSVDHYDSVTCLSDVPTSVRSLFQNKRISVVSPPRIVHPAPAPGNGKSFTFFHGTLFRPFVFVSRREETRIISISKMVIMCSTEPPTVKELQAVI